MSGDTNFKTPSSLFRGARISSRVGTRENNFNAIRLLAALAVIVSHAFPLSSGQEDPFTLVTRGQMSLGALSVDVFFVISGFLITQSYLRSRNGWTFARSRALRIFPALIVATTICAFVIGPLATRLPLPSYLSNGETYNFFLTIALHDSSLRYLPGVFDHNIYANVVNGSVWTLEAEVLCYAATGLLGIVRLLRAEVAGGLLILALAQPFLHELPLDYPWLTYLEFFRYFAAGMVLFLLAERLPLRGDAALVAAGLLLLSAISGRGLNSLGVVLGSYCVIWLAFSERVRSPSWCRYTDISYGVYIYAFPLQQTLVYFAGGAMNPLVNLVLALPPTIAAAYASWHLVEKRALRLKDARWRGVGKKERPTTSDLAPVLTPPA